MDRTIADLRHEVIENTLRLEIILEDIISQEMGFEPEFDGEKFLNEEFIRIFEKHLLNRLNNPQKCSLVMDIAKMQNKKLSSNFGKNFERIIQIRNEFAHTLSPNSFCNHVGIVGIAAKDYEKMLQELSIWEGKAKEHEDLFKKISQELKEHFFLNGGER